MAKTTKTPKAESIDLGALQVTYQKALRQTELDAKALVKAQEASGRSKAACKDAYEKLKGATQTILG